MGGLQSHKYSHSSWISDYVASFRDKDLNDELLWHLVSVVFGDRPSLYASILMGAGITLAAWGMTGAPVFLGIFCGHVIVGFARLHLLRKFSLASGARAPEASARSLDRSFFVWSTLYALMLGLTFYEVADMPNSNNALPLAIAGAVGFAVAFVTRNSARFRLLVFQILAVTLPLVYGLLALPIANGGYYAALIAGLVITTFMLGRSSNARIIAHYRVNETNRRMARFDTLTGILNRFSFNDALMEALGDEATRHFALIVIDLDRFKEINDTLGHVVGDQVIVEAAACLKAVVGERDIVARLGGDEFVVITHGEADELVGPDSMGERIVAALAQTIDVSSHALTISASVGVALYPEHGASPEELMKRADIALYESKRLGRNRCAVFDMALQKKLDDARQIESDMAVAISEDQFEAWLQPIFDIDVGAIIGYEALARWRHPAKGLIQPDLFIPVAEQTGAIVVIGERIMEKACAAAASWDRDLTIAVNLSPRQFRDAKALVESTQRILAATRLAPSRLYLEITESVMLEDTPQTREAVRQLADYGVRFSLDDFGSGYSSLSYVQNYPFSRIKIDRNFIGRLDKDDVSCAIVASVCLLAGRTHMDIVAEGVETLRQAATLKELGIHFAQGYLYGRPRKEAVAPEAAALVAMAAPSVLPLSAKAAV